jgi:hypothetical protein
MAQPFSMLLGIVLLGVGLWGTFTGGHAHTLMVFGINGSHNLVHVVSGALAIGVSLGSGAYARAYCVAFGAVYGLVAIAGFANVTPVALMLNLNAADNVLHLGIAAACLLAAIQSRPA